MPTAPAPTNACPQCGARVAPPTGGVSFEYGVGPVGHQSCAACGARWRYLWREPGQKRPRGLLALAGGVIAVAAAVGIVVFAVNQGSKSSHTPGNPLAQFGVNTPSTVPLRLHEPSVAELKRFVPGGVDTSTSVHAAEGAPLLCGGTRSSRLAGAAIVKVPRTLSQVAVFRYAFTSASTASAYFDALRAQAPVIQGAQCTVATADSGVFSAVSLIAIVGSTVADASGTTTYSSGLYSGAYQYNVARYVQQGRDVYLIRLDQQHDYPDRSFVDAVENAMNTRRGASLRSGAHSASPSTVQGVLQRGQWECCSFGQPPIGAIGRWAESEDMSCPVLIVSGTPYTIAIENQLPNVQPAGLVAFPSGSGSAVTIPWGAHVRVVVDTFTSAGSFGCRGGNQIAKGIFANAVSIAVSP
jgi:hypothetical protein